MYALNTFEALWFFILSINHWFRGKETARWLTTDIAHPEMQFSSWTIQSRLARPVSLQSWRIHCYMPRFPATSAAATQEDTSAWLKLEQGYCVRFLSCQATVCVCTSIKNSNQNTSFLTRTTTLGQSYHFSNLFEDVSVWRRNENHFSYITDKNYL